MRSSRTFLPQLAGASLLVVYAAANAVPATVSFHGTTTYYYDYGTGYDATKVGQPFSGWATFDPAGAEYTASDDLTTHAYRAAQSDRGCYSMVNGSCTTSFGSNPPVVGAYSISTPFPLSANQPVPDSADFYEYSYRQNVHYYPLYLPPSGREDYILVRNQYQYEYTGDLSSDYDQRVRQRVFNIFPYADGDGLLSSVFDLLAAPDLTVVPAGQWNFYFSDYGYEYDCNARTGCLFSSYSPGSFVLHGTLTSLTVPEPGSLALLAGALAGLAFCRRRRPH